MAQIYTFISFCFHIALLYCILIFCLLECVYELYCHLYYCSLSSYYSVLNKYLLLPKTVMLSAQAEKGEQRTLYILVSLGF